MTIEEIQTALDELVAAMVEKEVKRPKADLTMKPHGEKHYVYLSAEFKSAVFDGDDNKFCRAETVDECFEIARTTVAKIPDPSERVTREYLGKVAAAIDYATENSIADEYVTPLRGVTMAMTENLLTKEPTT